MIARAALVVLVVGCGSGAKPPDAGADRAIAPDVAVDMAVDVAPAAPDSAVPDTRPDAPADRPVDARTPADVSGDICSAGGLCRTLRAEYAEAVLRAQTCMPGAAGVCQKKAPGHLGCDRCEVFVTDTAELDPLLASFMTAGCDRCFLGSPTGDRCHPIACSTLFSGLCRPAAGGGTCVNDEPPQQCPDSAAAEAPCPIEKWICTRDTSPKICSCTRRQTGELRWECFF